MSNPLVFYMGKYAARIPADRRYSTNHMWLQPGQGRIRVGFTAYSVRLLQDVYFLEWTVAAGAAVALGQEIGQVESSKAVSSLYPPMAGRLVGFNRGVLDDPSAINTDNYGAGWLYDLEADAPGLSPDEYVAFLGANWEKTQQMIKGQINQD